MDFISRHQIIVETGLSEDYLNAWGTIPLLSSLQIRGKYIHPDRVQVRDYRTYLHVKRGETLAQQIVAHAKHGTIAPLDSLVIEFNSLDVSARLEMDIFSTYISRLRNILNTGKPD